MRLELRTYWFLDRNLIAFAIQTWCVLLGISNSWIQVSFLFHDSISTQHILLLSCKALNLITTSSPRRSTVSKSRLNGSNPPCIFAVNHIIYFFICTYVFYFCLWPSLCATTYLPVKSVKVLCVSLPTIILFTCLMVHLHWEIWLWEGKSCGFHD